jgi:hypothetical protein
MKKRKRTVAALAAVMLSAALCAQGTTIVRMDLDELTRAASVVVRVRCVSNEARSEHGTLWTVTTFDVLETLKGSTPQRIAVRLVGGRAGNVRVRVEGVPRFAADEEAYLFLEPNRLGELTVTSWAQGTFRVHRGGREAEQVTQDTGGLSVFDPATRQFREGDVRSLPVSEFRQRVRQAVERLRGKEQP